MGAFPELELRCATVPSDKNLFVVRYSPVGSGGRPSLSVHKDNVPLTVNISLSAHCSYAGGGTYFPAKGGECNGIVLRPHAGTAILHDGNVEVRAAAALSRTDPARIWQMSSAVCLLLTRVCVRLPPRVHSTRVTR